jgi:hypothetical protein
MCLLDVENSFSLQLKMMVEKYPISEALKFKYYLIDKPLGTLYQDIENHKVDSIYFSSDLKTIYSHESSRYPSVLYDFDITNSNPLLANSIIEFSNKDNDFY